MFTTRKTGSKAFRTVSAVLLGAAVAAFAVPGWSGPNDRANDPGPRPDHRELIPKELADDKNWDQCVPLGPPMAHAEAYKKYQKNVKQKLEKCRQGRERK